MDSELGAFIDEPSVSRFAVRQKSRAQAIAENQRARARSLSAGGADSTEWEAAAAVEEDDSLTYESGAAIGDARFEEQELLSTVTRRLIELEASFYEDYGAQLDTTSKAGLMCFMRYSPDASFPLLGAESTGKLVATWVHGEECLSLRFLDRYRFHFALTTAITGQPVRRWGTAHSLTFFAEEPDAKRVATISA
jgi:hypothetical protein